MSHIALAACALALLPACEEEPPPAPPPPKKKAEPVTSRGDAASQPVEKFVYSSIGKRDPFRPYYIDQALEEEEKNTGRTLTELEHFEIDQLKLVGIVTGTSMPSAMVEDPDGVGHTIMIGTLMGKNGGRVKQIKRDEVLIIEEFRDPATNKKVASPVTLKLPSDEFLLR
ncbi:MAG: pilus assembly protein PilP [Deltaproteobacteria bacterium]|nr:pilus assembly protein PilP [Deltaproteobacteria bacterium]